MVDLTSYAMIHQHHFVRVLRRQNPGLVADVILPRVSAGCLRTAQFPYFFFDFGLIVTDSLLILLTTRLRRKTLAQRGFLLGLVGAFLGVWAPEVMGLEVVRLG